MIWLIIGLIIWIAFTIYFIYDGCYSFSEIIGCSSLTLIASMLVSTLILLMASLIISDCAEIDYSNKVSDTKIIALKDNQNATGSFYIMGGYVNEDLYYYYATETEFGYKTEKIESDNAYIKYTDGEAHIEEYEAEFAKDYLYWFAAPDCSNRYIIYCPEGTITNEFAVDLE